MKGDTEEGTNQDNQPEYSDVLQCVGNDHGSYDIAGNEKFQTQNDRSAELSPVCAIGGPFRQLFESANENNR
jgi:hypothetical protein